VSDPRPEFAFIEAIRSRALSHPCVRLGIGDDAALLRIPPPGDCLVTVDMLTEGVDFRLPETAPRDVGRKALAVSLSDIAAMAGRPLAAVISVALPQKRGREFAEEVQAGIEAIAREFAVAIAGGDTNAWDGPAVLCSTVIGAPTGSGPVRRSGAKVGDWILVTGDLGGSLAGKHVSFRPRVQEALALHEAAALHAMIDISDGLAADLHHILDESGVGAVLRAADIPISAAARQMAGAKTPLEQALGDGEDFELLFTVSPEDGRRLLASRPFEAPLAVIGEITAERGCTIVDASGRSAPLPPQGWVHRF